MTGLFGIRHLPGLLRIQSYSSAPAVSTVFFQRRMWASVTVSIEKHAASPHSAFAGGETQSHVP
jgi:hypothetical protein